MATKRLPDISYIRECVDYDPITGVFTWRERPPHHFPHPKAHKWWNTKFAGKPAGTGTRSRQNYWRLCLGGNFMKAHRVVWLLERGEPVPDIIDHIDGDTLNNRISNLRIATNSQNLANSARRLTTNVKGVHLRHRGNSIRFLAYLTVHGKRHSLGYFATLEEAATARREAAQKAFGEFARHD